MLGRLEKNMVIDTLSQARFEEIIQNDGGRIIHFGYSSTGMSKSRGFKKVGICLVCHNGDHNDTICLVEEKINQKLF